MRVAGLVHDSIVDGPGLRYTVFTQGCVLHCTGCHNPDTWDHNGGTEISIDFIINDMLSNKLIDGLTLSGGEPFEQAAECAQIAAAAVKNGLSVWIFTGKTFEELRKEAAADTAAGKLMALTNVLVDGRFIEKDRTLSLKWCGSKNQQVLDMQKSLIAGKRVLYEQG